jgi:hypothetical protein
VVQAGVNGGRLRLSTVRSNQACGIAGGAVVVGGALQATHRCGGTAIRRPSHPSQYAQVAFGESKPHRPVAAVVAAGCDRHAAVRTR